MELRPYDPAQDGPDFDALITTHAERTGVPKNLLNALLKQESSFNPKAVNAETGATGLGQLMPGTATALGVTDRTDPEQSIRAAADYLREGYDREGTVRGALTYYYGGPNKAQWGTKTEAYPDQVLRHIPQMERIGMTFGKKQAEPKLKSYSEAADGPVATPEFTFREYDPATDGGMVDPSNPPAIPDAPTTPVPKTAGEAFVHGEFETGATTEVGPKKARMRGSVVDGAPVKQTTFEDVNPAFVAQLKNATPDVRELVTSEDSPRGVTARRLVDGWNKATPTERQALNLREDIYAEAIGSGATPEAANAYVERRIFGGEGKAGLGPSTFDFDTAAEYKNKNPVVRGLAKGKIGMGKAALGIAEAATDLAGVDADRVKAASKRLSGQEEGIGEGKGEFNRNLEGVIASIVTQGPGLAVGIFSGGAAIPLMTMGASSFGQEYTEGKQAGLAPQDSAQRAAIYAVAEVIGERVGMPSFMRSAKAALAGAKTKDLVPLLAKHVAAEIPGEQLTALIQFGTDKLAPFGLTPNATLEDYLNQAKDTLIQTVMQAGLLSGATLGTGKAIEKVQEYQASTPEGRADAARDRALQGWADIRLRPATAEEVKEVSRETPREPVGDIAAVPSAGAPVQAGPADLEAGGVRADATDQPAEAEGAQTGAAGPQAQAVGKLDGSPFANKGSAVMAAKRLNLTDHTPVQVEGGWMLQPPVSPASETTKQDNELDDAAGRIQANSGETAPERRTRATLQSPDDVVVGDFIKRAGEEGIAEDVARKLAPRAQKDDVTGYFDARADGVKSAAIERAKVHVAKTGEEAHLIAADIGNLGGLNAFLKNVSADANKHFRALTDFMVNRLKGLGGDVIPLRTGGDELMVIVGGISQADVERAMAGIQKDVESYAMAEGLDAIPHPKKGKPGLNLYMGRAVIRPSESVGSIISQAERGLDAGKVDYERRSKTEKAAAGTPEGQAGRAGPDQPGGAPAVRGEGPAGTEADSGKTEGQVNGDKPLPAQPRADIPQPGDGPAPVANAADAAGSGTAPPAPARPAPATRRTRLTPLANPRLNDPATRTAIEGLRGEIGWAETGGILIRNPQTGDVIGRTPWVPHSDFWPNRPSDDAISHADGNAAFTKALAGEPLTKKQKRFIEYTLEYLARGKAEEDRHADNEFLAEIGYDDLSPAQSAAADRVVERLTKLAKQGGWEDVLVESVERAAIVAETDKQFRMELIANVRQALNVTAEARNERRSASAEGRVREGQVVAQGVQSGRESSGSNAEAKAEEVAPESPAPQSEGLAASEASKSAAEADIPPAYFLSTTVKGRVYNENTKTVELQDMPASEALESLREDIEAMDALIICLGAR